MAIRATAQSEASDDALMARLAARDREALAMLLAVHRERPYRIAWRMLGDRSEAEDVAQEAFVRLWRTAGDWRPNGAGIAAWLARVATNLCLDQLRKRRFASDEEVPERADGAPLADAAMDAEALRLRTVGAIQDLPDRQRAAIVLTYYEEQPNQAAADILEMNIKAFESLLLRARQALRARFEREGVLSTGDLL